MRIAASPMVRARPVAASGFRRPLIVRRSLPWCPIPVPTAFAAARLGVGSASGVG